MAARRLWLLDPTPVCAKSQEQGLTRFLKPKGRLVNIDFHEWELPVGPPPHEKVSRETFIAMAKEAGYAVVASPHFSRISTSWCWLREVKASRMVRDVR
jgi:hypothetical protein